MGMREVKRERMGTRDRRSTQRRDCDGCTDGLCIDRFVCSTTLHSFIYSFILSHTAQLIEVLICATVLAPTNKMHVSTASGCPIQRFLFVLTTRISFLSIHCSKKICSIVSNRVLLDVLTVMLIIKSGCKALDESYVSCNKESY